MRAKRSRIRSYLIEPFKQIRFGLHVVGVCFTFLVVLGWMYANAFYEQYEQVFELFQVAEKQDLVNNSVFIKNGTIIGSTLTMFALAIMFVVIRRTHKMYGPMVSIMRFVGELSKGHFAVRINVREKDDFQQLVGSLNNLAEYLHKTHGAGNKSGLDALDDRLDAFEDGVVIVQDFNNKAS